MGAATPVSNLGLNGVVCYACMAWQRAQLRLYQLDWIDVTGLMLTWLAGAFGMAEAADVDRALRPPQQPLVQAVRHVRPVNTEVWAHRRIRGAVRLLYSRHTL